MSVTTLLDDIVPQVREGYGRSTGSLSLLRLIEKGQDHLLDYDGPALKYLGTDNQGWAPYLETVAGTYEYSINAASLANITSLVRRIGGVDYPIRAKRVLKVFVDATNVDYGRRWIGSAYMYGWNNPYTTDFRNLEVADIPIESYQATADEDARIIFKEDPGTTSDKYYIVFTIEAPRLTSELVPLIVPETYEEALEDYVVGTVQKRENGKTNERWMLFWVDRPGMPCWRTRFKHDCAIGAQATARNKVNPRVC